MTKADYYELLGVSRTASFDEIKRAFRLKAKECHPDHHREEGAEEQFKAINEAYEVLKDQQKRAAYDQYGHAAFENGMGSGGFGGAGFGGFNFSNMGGFEGIFDEIFSGFAGAGARRANRPNKGEDIRYDLELTLQEAYTGLKKQIEITTFVACPDCEGKGGTDIKVCPTCQGRCRLQQRQGFFVVESECPTCHGLGKVVGTACKKCTGTGRIKKTRSLEVNIPAGVSSGVRMRLSGEGNAALHGGEAGDLYVFLNIKKDFVFHREGDDLYASIPISMVLATLGGEFQVPLINGEMETVSIKAGTQTGTQIKLKGQGMPVLKAGRFGDYYVSFIVETPTKLTEKQKELLRSFSEEESKKEPEDSFFNRIKKIWNG